MKLAISNLAWPAEQEPAVAELLPRLGVTGVEVAPTRVWPRLDDVTDAQIDRYRAAWERRGLQIIAAQALLFGRPELTLFETAEAREATLRYLERVVRLCGRLGAQALVFGSPKNRRRGSQTHEMVWPVAVEFFSRLAKAAAAEGTCVVLEANPPEYGADFLTRAAEALELVRAVAHPGLALHLDTACMMLAGDSWTQMVAAVGPLLRHVHISEPGLGSVGQSTVRHDEVAQPLRAARYSHWISIEMLPREPFTLDSVGDAIQFVRRTYLDEVAAR